MGKFSNLFYFVILPLAGVAFIFFHRGFEVKKTEAKQAAHQAHLDSPKGYRQNFVKSRFSIDLDTKGSIYLKGNIKNTGTKRIKSLTVTLRPVHKGLPKPKPVKIGPIGPETEKRISRKVVENSGKTYVEYTWTVSDLVLE